MSRDRPGKYRNRTSKVVAAAICAALLAILYVFFFDAIESALGHFFLPVPISE